MTKRREFVRQLAWAVVPVALIPRQVPQGKSGAAAADTLAFSLGSTRPPLGPMDNDRGVIAIERRLHCSCGCTLDVYTCRTTDFSCTYSPAMHAKVVSQVQGGMTADQILAWFVAQPEYGAKVLMAPPARGFNVMGYIVPGLTVTAFGLALAAWLVRKKGVPAAAAPLIPPPAGDVEQLARLQRALDDVES